MENHFRNPSTPFRPQSKTVQHQKRNLHNPFPHPFKTTQHPASNLPSNLPSNTSNVFTTCSELFHNLFKTVPLPDCHLRPHKTRLFKFNPKKEGQRSGGKQHHPGRRRRKAASVPKKEGRWELQHHTKEGNGSTTPKGEGTQAHLACAAFSSSFCEVLSPRALVVVVRALSPSFLGLLSPSPPCGWRCIVPSFSGLFSPSPPCGWCSLPLPFWGGAALSPLLMEREEGVLPPSALLWSWCLPPSLMAFPLPQDNLSRLLYPSEVNSMIKSQKQQDMHHWEG